MASAPPPAAGPAHRDPRTLLALAVAVVALAAAAIIWYGRAGSARDLALLRAAPAWEERVNAALRLGRARRRDAAPALVAALLGDPSQRVRANARWALREITGQPWGLDEAACVAWWERGEREFARGAELPELGRPAPPAPLPRPVPLEARLEFAAAPGTPDRDHPVRLTVTLQLKNVGAAPLRVETLPVESYDVVEVGAGGAIITVVEPTPPLSFVEVEVELNPPAAGGVTATPLRQGLSLAGTEIPAGGQTAIELEFLLTRPATALRAHVLPTRLLVRAGETAGTVGIGPLAARDASPSK
ncbi:MAG: hypothetical protein HZA54_07470 [Planctomycetes bacterium]|nr:hypothetical protein [Planctomycetota bacterium]